MGVTMTLTVDDMAAKAAVLKPGEFGLFSLICADTLAGHYHLQGIIHITEGQ